MAERAAIRSAAAQGGGRLGEKRRAAQTYFAPHLGRSAGLGGAPLLWHTSTSPMSSAPQSHRPVPRPFLERVARPLLARLLAGQAAVLESQRFPLAALAASDQTDRAHVDALWRLLLDPPAELHPLRDDLLAVADVATHAGHELLLGHDRARALDHELGAEDCAALAYLDHRALFEAARPQTAGQSQTKSFASYQAGSPRALGDDAACPALFQRRMAEELVARGRSDYLRVHESRSGAERHFEIVYGKLASARDLIGKKNGAHDVTAQVTDRTTERAHAVFHDDTLRLDMAGYDWMKELVRSVFGEAYFADAGHFRGGDTISLAPLADLGAALSSQGVAGLREVELIEVLVELGAKRGAWVAIGDRVNCLRGAAADYAIRALGDGVAVEASFLLFLTTRTRPVRLKVAVHKGRLEFERRDPRIARVVRDWVVARGFLSVPEHLRASIERAHEASELAPS